MIRLQRLLQLLLLSNVLVSSGFVLSERVCCRRKPTSLHEQSKLKDDNISSQTRRNILSSIPMASILSLIPFPSEAKKDDEIILQTSTSNFPRKYEGTSTLATPMSSEEEDALTETELRRIAVFERVAPSVVYIDTFLEQRDAFSTNVMEVPLGAGSGIVWDDRGHIITNYHVIRTANVAQVAILTKVFSDSDSDSESSPPKRKYSLDSSRISSQVIPFTSMRPVSKIGDDPNITKYKRRVYKARVVGVDPGKDIAVLKIDAPVYDLHPIQLGSSSLKVGQTAMAIGNPFGLDHTLTTGIISGIGREVRSPIGRPISNTIQTDAAVNPGNSGGPLLNSSGKMIGMNTAIFSPTGASAGIGFAIPVDTVQYIVETLIRDGKIVRPIIGISYLESKQAMSLGITKGVLVLDVPQSSPAFKAGMRGTRRTPDGLIEIGDIIVGIEEDEIENEADLFAALEKYKPGDKVRVKVKRVEQGADGRKAKDLDLLIQLKPSQEIVPVGMAGGGGKIAPPLFID